MDKMVTSMSVKDLIFGSLQLPLAFYICIKLGIYSPDAVWNT